jgi:hypothetical protein
MRKIVFIILALGWTGCATVFKGYMSEVEIRSNTPDSLQVYTAEGIQVAAPYKTRDVKSTEAFAEIGRRVAMYDSTTHVIQLRSSKDHLLILKRTDTEQKYVAYAKMSGGWFILDLVCGGFPIIVDAITGNWNYFDNIQYEGK